MSGGAGAGSGSGARRVDLFQNVAGQEDAGVDEDEDEDEDDWSPGGRNGSLRGGGRSMRPRWSCCCGLVERTRGERDAQQSEPSIADLAREQVREEGRCCWRIWIS